DGNQEQLLRRLAGRLQEEVYRLAQTDPLPHVNPIELIRMTKEVETEIIDAMEARQNQMWSAVAGQRQPSDASAKRASDAEPTTVVDEDPVGCLAGSWVPVSACISKEVPQLKDHTAVRRFCKDHRIPTRTPRKQRREVHWDSFQKVKKQLEGCIEKLEATADTLKSLREHEQRTGSRFPTG
ncbi:MAG: hypothetical protein IT456_21395, partial [Planctomycetes bacterium]|nr:hypothetical protein [Planctomycetota bacterium]